MSSMCWYTVCNEYFYSPSICPITNSAARRLLSRCNRLINLRELFYVSAAAARRRRHRSPTIANRLVSFSQHRSLFHKPVQNRISQSATILSSARHPYFPLSQSQSICCFLTAVIFVVIGLSFFQNHKSPPRPEQE